jgi:hypothetical protein
MAPALTLATVLRIDELMQLVWSFLGNPDLASLACVSRELSPYALAALYLDLASVGPLFHLITRDMYRWEDFGEPVRPLSPSALRTSFSRQFRAVVHQKSLSSGAASIVTLASFDILRLTPTWRLVASQRHQRGTTRTLLWRGFLLQ